MSFRCGYRPFRGPSRPNPHIDDAVWKASNCSQSRVIPTRSFSWPAIAGLLSSGLPPTILWSVRTVVVDASKRSSVWFPPHVCEEVFKLIPSLAALDSASAVVLPVVASGVCCALPHSVPGVVFRGANSSRRITVNDWPSSHICKFLLYWL